jgi:predicted ATPase
LQAAYPVELELEALQDHLTVAMRANLIEIETPNADIAYLFRHVITQQVAYELLLLNQREQLHRALAVWYEQEAAENLTPYFPVLARHWQHACEPAKAVDYFDRAADSALRNGGYREAAEFLQDALALSELAGLEIESLLSRGR